MEYSVRLPSFLFPVYQLTLRQSQEYDENYRKIFFMLTDKENCMPTVLIDADGCPVVDLTIRICKRCGVPVLILCDTAHRIERDGAETLVFDKGAEDVYKRQAPSCCNFLSSTVCQSVVSVLYL